MTQAAIINLADAIVTALNAHAFSQPFTAVRAFIPRVDLGEMSETLHVTVVPTAVESKLDTRTTSQHEYVVEIGVQKKPPSLANVSLDPLMRLVEEIADFFLFGIRPAGTTLIAPNVRILFLQEHLAKFSQFTSVITLTCRGWR